MEHRSISELEGWKWKGEVPTRETHGGVECRFYELHRMPLAKLDLSDVRFLIGQNSGLEYLVPLAIDRLTENIFIETEYYPGDLLYSLLSINNEPNYWKFHNEERHKLIALYTEQKANLGYIDATDEIIRHIKEGYKNFLDGDSYV